MSYFGKGIFSKEAADCRQAAEQGDAAAQVTLGEMYAAGEGVLQSYKEAAHWYRQAAEQGDALAQAMLGGMYCEGKGVLKNLVKAHMWFNIAAANGLKGTRETRDTIAKTMTTQQIEEAQARARVCVENHYKDCGAEEPED